MKLSAKANSPIPQIHLINLSERKTAIPETFPTEHRSRCVLSGDRFMHLEGADAGSFKTCHI